MRRLAILAAASSLLAVFARAQEDSGPGVEDGRIPPQARGNSGPKDAQKGFEQMQQIMKSMQEKELEKLKANDPQAYEEQMENAARRRKIEKVVAQARAGTLSPEQAESQLRPLIKPDLDAELAGLKDRIARLEKRLSFLRRVEKDPDFLLRRRAQQMLGRGQPEAGDSEPVW